MFFLYLLLCLEILAWLVHNARVGGQGEAQVGNTVVEAHLALAGHIRLCSTHDIIMRPSGSHRLTVLEVMNHVKDKHNCTRNEANKCVDNCRVSQ